MMNDYLRGRMSRMRIDGRNPYGSRGGYVIPSRRARRMSERMDYRSSMPEYNSRYDYERYGSRDSNYDLHHERYPEYNRPMEYEISGVAGVMPRDYRDYRYDYAMGEEEEERRYKKDLEEWCERMKKRDRFNWDKEEVYRNAKEMNATFKGYDKDELYAIYLAEQTDHPQAYNEPRNYILRAIERLEDDDIAVSPSEMVCIYLYEIVKGEEE